MTTPDRSARLPSKAGIGGSLAGGAALALTCAVAALRVDEGKRNVDYRDIAGIPTGCYGHTGADVHVGQRRSDADCDALLTKDAQAHMNGVLACTPGLATRPYQLAAATRLTFNIGVGAYCRSGAASAFRRGDWSRGCDLFLPWDKARVRGQLVRVKGLADRRQRERAMCRTDLGGRQ